MAFFCGWCQSVSRSNTSTCCGRFWEPRCWKEHLAQKLIPGCRQKLCFRSGLMCSRTSMIFPEAFYHLMEPILPVRWMDVNKGDKQKMNESTFPFGRSERKAKTKEALLAHESHELFSATPWEMVKALFPAWWQICRSWVVMQKDIVPQCHQIWVNVNPGLINHGLLIRRVLLQ